VTRGLLRVATAGSVDDGKSTLIGRLLHDAKAVFADQLEAVEDASRRRGYGEADLALLVDGLRAEREQGITIDVAYRYFATPRRARTSPSWRSGAGWPPGRPYRSRRCTATTWWTARRARRGTPASRCWRTWRRWTWAPGGPRAATPVSRSSW